jgi:hypothetical protein
MCDLYDLGLKISRRAIFQLQFREENQHLRYFAKMALKRDESLNNSNRLADMHEGRLLGFRVGEQHGLIDASFPLLVATGPEFRARNQSRNCK